MKSLGKGKIRQGKKIIKHVKQKKSDDDSDIIDIHVQISNIGSNEP